MAISGGPPAGAASAATAAVTAQPAYTGGRPASELEDWRRLLTIFSNYSSVLDEWVRVRHDD